jgi:hypothetical protein
MVVEERVSLYGLEDESIESEEGIIDRIDYQREHSKREALMKDSWKMIQSSKKKVMLILLYLLSSHNGTAIRNSENN